MKLLSKRNAFILVVLLALSITFVGCASKGDQSNEGENSMGLSGRVTLVGSTSVTPTAEAIGAAFMEENTDVKVEVQGVGSSAGVKATEDGSADIGMTSRGLKEEEKNLGIEEHIIAYDGIAIIVHPNNKVSDLTPEQIGKIYKGEISNWNQVGGQDIEIEVISREEGSGTRSAFEELMGLESEEGTLVKKDASFADGNGAIYANVVQKENAIGYISLSYLDGEVKALKVDGVECTVDSIKSGKYAVSRPFLMLTKGDISKEAQAYLDYVLGEAGQKIVEEQGAISVR